MTKKLFDLDSYVTTVTGKVLSCAPCEKNGLTGWSVELEETCFFPEGGGQPADVGTLGGKKVLYTYEKDGIIYHLCDGALEKGQTVTGEIDFTQRFSNMQAHCGEHILSGIALRDYQRKNVGFHMGHECNTIDLDGELSPEQCQELEQKVNQIIAANGPVKVYYPDAETLKNLPLRKKPEVDNLRVVEVTGYDYCGCCGTHVARTGEIGLLKIIDAQRYKGGMRLFFLCGFKALEDYQKKHTLLKQAAEGFSCKPLEVGENITRLQQEVSSLKGRLADKNRELIGFLGEKLLAEGKAISYHDNMEIKVARWVFLASDTMSPDEVKAFAMAMAKEKDTLCTSFSRGKDGIKYALSRSADCAALPLKELCQRINQAFSGKGGGKDLCCGSMNQVSNEELQNEILRFFAE